MGGLIEFMMRLGTARIVAITGALFMVTGFFIFMMFRVTTPNFSLLYGDLAPDSLQQMTERLAERNVSFELRNQNREIWVPEDEVSSLRLTLAEDGIGGSILGYEIFDRDSALGQSNLVQEVNRLRALEGELARTISQLEHVSSARVHIVLPKRELFTRDKQTTKATVVMKMKGSNRLTQQQVVAVQHLVATSIPELTPDNITIVDNKGILLHAGGDTDGGRMALVESTEMKASYENEVATKVTQLLEHSVGFGKVRVEVYAQMDFSQEVVNADSFDPDQQVARSEESINERASSSEGTDGSLTVANNLPDAEQFVANSAGIQENSNRTEERVNYEIGRIQTNRVIPPGRVDRLSVAVLVDGSYIENADGGFTYQPRPEEEMQQLEALVKSAVGFDETRGDEIDLANMPFVDTVPIPEERITLYFGFTIEEIKKYLEWLGLAAIFTMILLLIVRPLIIRVLDFRDALDGEEDEKPKFVLNKYGQVVPVGDEEGGDDDEDGLEGLINIANVEGQVKASSLRKIGELIDKHPEEAVALIRSWMYEDRN